MSVLLDNIAFYGTTKHVVQVMWGWISIFWCLVIAVLLYVLRWKNADLIENYFIVMFGKGLKT